MSLVAIKNVISSTIAGKGADSSRLSPGSHSNYGTVDDRGSQVASEEQCSEENSVAASNKTSGTVFGNFDPRVMSDMIIGLSDGLTVPFALTAGLSSLGDSKLVITGGFAELISGAISMGLGGYLAAKSESQYYNNEVTKEKQNYFKNPQELEYELIDILEDIGINNENTINMFINDLEKQPKKMVDFIIRFGKGLEEPAENRQFTSALTIGLSYFIGGFIPLIPYFFVSVVQTGLMISCIVMAITLFIFGYVKTIASLGSDCNIKQKIFEGVQMLFVGGIAAASAWFMVRMIEVY